MTDDLRARLDAAITAARKDIDRCIEREKQGDTLYAQVRTAETIDRYTALVELRARWEVIDRRGCERRTKTGTCIDKGDYSPCSMCRWVAEIEADVRRLLPVDGSAEAHSGRKSDQLSG